MSKTVLFSERDKGTIQVPGAYPTLATSDTNKGCAGTLNFADYTSLKSSIDSAYTKATDPARSTAGNSNEDFTAMGRWDQTGASYPLDTQHTWTDGWPIGALCCTQYNHVLPPNSSSRDCVISGDRVPDRPSESAIVSARSSHPGVVNVVFADGHGDSISQDVDLNVWRALGTRDGGSTNFMNNTSETSLKY